MENYAPANQLQTNRSLGKFILLSVFTLGIYSIVFYNKVRKDMNLMCGNHNGQPSMNYWLLILIITPITLGIGYLVWFHKISTRIGAEMRYRNIQYDFGASTFWLWNILGSIIIVGPFIYVHKLCTAMNMLAEHYNING